MGWAPEDHRHQSVVGCRARRYSGAARNKRLPIPLGWAINSAGEPTTDPQEAIDGIILPMAEHKGYAIAAMVDMLSGVLTGSGFLSAVHSPYKTAEKSNCGHLMIALHIEAFQPLAQFNARMEQFIAEIKSVPLAKGFDEVFYPGEIEAKNDTRNRGDGIRFPDDTLADLKQVARETGLEARLPFS
jgi:LDH2 family malate/lactate/ureidoglycolate dehydrogenase